MRGDVENQILPLLVVVRRIRPSFSFAGLAGPWNVVRIGVAGQRLRHEAKLDHGMNTGMNPRVKDAVKPAPVVDGVAVGVLTINIGVSPLQPRLALAVG